jgi:prevent-host-death family protein
MEQSRGNHICRRYLGYDSAGPSVVFEAFQPGLVRYRSTSCVIQDLTDAIKLTIMYIRVNIESCIMTVNIVEVRSKLADTVNRVMYQGERVVLERRGKGVAAIVSMDDLALLEKLEDQADVKAAKKALADMKRKKQKPIPYEKLRKELGL